MYGFDGFLYIARLVTQKVRVPCSVIDNKLLGDHVFVYLLLLYYYYFIIILQIYLFNIYSLFIIHIIYLYIPFFAYYMCCDVYM